jgi:hypothetical protein
MTRINPGDRVRAHFFKRRFNRRLNVYENDFVCAKIGVVEFIHRDQAMVRFEGGKPERVPVSALERVKAEVTT